MSAGALPMSGQPRALIIEDERLWSTILERVLQQLGVSSHIVHDAEGARIALAEHRFDIVLVDLQLPGHAGMGLIDEIKRDKALARRCIIVTGHSMVANYFSDTIPVVDKLRLHDLKPHILRLIEAGTTDPE